MNLRLPPKLPIVGRNKGLHAWLNRLLEAVQAQQVHVSHRVKKVQGHQGITFEGNPAGDDPTQEAPTTSTPRWG